MLASPVEVSRLNGYRWYADRSGCVIRLPHSFCPRYETTETHADLNLTNPRFRLMNSWANISLFKLHIIDKTTSTYTLLCLNVLQTLTMYCFTNDNLVAFTVFMSSHLPYHLGIIKCNIKILLHSNTHLSSHMDGLVTSPSPYITLLITANIRFSTTKAKSTIVRFLDIFSFYQHSTSRYRDVPIFRISFTSIIRIIS